MGHLSGAWWTSKLQSEATPSLLLACKGPESKKAIEWDHSKFPDLPHFNERDDNPRVWFDQFRRDAIAYPAINKQTRGPFRRRWSRHKSESKNPKRNGHRSTTR